MPGWSSGGWGSSPWGLGVDPLKLEVVQPRRENAVRLTFNLPVRYTQLLDPKDGSNPDRYNVSPVAGTSGADQLPTRPVTPIVIQQVSEEGAEGKVIDVVVDRPFSPYPAQYVVAVNALVSIFNTPLDPSFASRQFDGLRMGIVPLLPDHMVERRDIANPQSLEALVDESPIVFDPDLLAGYPVGDDGDYATDAGVISYKKRIFRRLMSSKGRFAHLLNYGVGVLAQVKQLGRANIRQTIVAEAESQIREEPETADVAVRLDQGEGGLWVLSVRARMRTGQTVSMNVPLGFAQAA